MERITIGCVNDYRKNMPDRDHVVQVSVQRSGRVWISSMVNYVLGGSAVISIDHPLKTYHDWTSGKQMYFATHWYANLPLTDKARYILLVRDPRDSILSRIKFQKNGDAELEDVLFRNWNTIAKWCTEWEMYLDIFLPRNTLVVQYERMLLYPASTIARLVDFSGLRIKYNISDTINEFDIYKFGKVISCEQRYKKQALKWQKEARFTEKHNKFILNCVGHTMAKYGYTEDGHCKEMFRDWGVCK